MSETHRQNVIKALIFCDHYMVDAKGKPSFIGVFENISFPTLPGTVGRFFFITQITDVAGEKLGVALLNPAGEALAHGELGLEDVIARSQTANITWELAGITFSDQGIYSATVSIDGRQIGQLDLDIRIAEA